MPGEGSYKWKTYYDLVFTKVLRVMSDVANGAWLGAGFGARFIPVLVYTETERKRTPKYAPNRAPFPTSYSSGYPFKDTLQDLRSFRRGPPHLTLNHGFPTSRLSWQEEIPWTWLSWELSAYFSGSVTTRFEPATFCPQRLEQITKPPGRPLT